MFVKYSNTNNSHHSGIYITQGSATFEVIRNWYMDFVQDNRKPSPAISRLMSSGILIGFSQNDFINVGAYRGFTKLFKCNSTTPKYFKKYLGKGLGMAHIIGFKIPDYDQSVNYLFTSNINVLHMIKGKMIEEFPPYPDSLYEYDIEKEYGVDLEFEYDRCWEHIKGLTPQEKIVLANVHEEEPFPNSYYENDRGRFAKKTQQDEFSIRLDSMTSDLDIRDYEGDDTQNAFDKVDKIISEREQSLIDSIKEGFDYGDFQDFSDIYTRTSTSIEDYELYPVRVNCLPKSVRKKGKSPYDTKLGLRQWRWFNHYQKATPLETWRGIPHGSPKYDWELSEEEKLADEYDLPDNFWEEIEMAYQSR